MTGPDKLQPEMLRKLPELYTHAVVAWVGEDGYPVSVASYFEVDPDHGLLRLTPMPAAPTIPPIEGAEVVFSHIRPQPGIGYDQRRYLSIHGQLEPDADGLRVIPRQISGWDENEIHFVEYSERGLGQARAYMDRLSRERGTEVRPRLSPGWLFLRATRLPFVTATAVPVLLGIAVAAQHHKFDLGLAALTLLAAVAVHLGLNVVNDVFDTLSGADAATLTPTQFSGGSRVIIYGLVRMRTMVLIALAFYAVGLGIGIYLAVLRGFAPLFVLGLVGLVISYAYVGPPFRLVHRGLGEIAVGLGFGPLMVLGAYFVQARSFSLDALYVSLPVGILVALILYLNEIPDRVGDTAVGKLTLPARLTKEHVLAGYRLGLVVAFGLIVAGVLIGLLPKPTLIALAAIPMAVGVSQRIEVTYDRPYELMPVLGANIKLHILFGLLLVSGYAALALGNNFVR